MKLQQIDEVTTTLTGDTTDIETLIRFASFQVEKMMKAHEDDELKFYYRNKLWEYNELLVKIEEYEDSI